MDSGFVLRTPRNDGVGFAPDDSGANGCLRCNHELVSTMRCAEKPQGLHRVITRFRDTRRMQEVAAAQSLLDSGVVFPGFHRVCHDGEPATRGVRATAIYPGMCRSFSGIINTSEELT